MSIPFMQVFSAAGDSGSWVFSNDAKVVGIVVSIAGTRKENGEEAKEVYFHIITPIEAVFDDIEAETGCQMSVAVDPLDGETEGWLWQSEES